MTHPNDDTSPGAAYARGQLAAAAAELSANRAALEETPAWRVVTRERLRRRVRELEAAAERNRGVVARSH